MNFFKQFTDKNSPKDTAKDRLRLILIHDRADLSPELLENIKEDILKVIQKYADIYQENVEVSLTKVDDESGGKSPALVANIPLKRIKR